MEQTIRFFSVSHALCLNPCRRLGHKFFELILLGLVTSLLLDRIACGQDRSTAEATGFKALKAESIQKWADSDLIVTGKITKVSPTGITVSGPPIYHFDLEIASNDVLRASVATDRALSVSYSIRKQSPPAFPHATEECVLGLTYARERWRLIAIEKATDDALEQATLAAKFPLGWKSRGGKLTSPWARYRPYRATYETRCCVTGRPILLAGPGIHLQANAILPANRHHSDNPTGDGEFELIVTNATDSEVEVPALLTDGTTISWHESVIIRCQGWACPLWTGTGNLEGLQPVKLKPRESVTRKIHALQISGPIWPNGGDRVEFQFCLGEISTTQSFYYHSIHHDEIRKKLWRELNSGE